MGYELLAKIAKRVGCFVHVPPLSASIVFACVVDCLFDPIATGAGAVQKMNRPGDKDVKIR
jgi:hypothetical protein